MRIFLVILAALIVAGGTGFYMLQGLQPQAAAPATAEAPKLRKVFVPAEEIAVGTLLVPEQLARMEITEAALSDEMIVASDAGAIAITGSVARRVLAKGVPIARSAIVQPGDRGFLAAVLPQGMRAISIPVTETAGLNGLALPGDWVDLILTYTVSAKGDDGDDNAGSKPRDVHASETVARNIRVLALDNRVNPQHEDDKGKPVPAPVPRTATLQVTPRQAEAITLASTLGGLSLALNSVRDGGEAEDASAPMTTPISLGAPALSRQAAPRREDMTLDSDVTSLLRLEVQSTVPEQVSRIQVVRGTGRTGLAETRPIRTDDAAADVPPADADLP
jgi:pilus assembly protein CpaB